MGFLSKIKNGFSNAFDTITGNKTATVEAPQAQSVNVSDDSVAKTKDLYKEGADVAARQANNASAIAGANAKANAVMSGGSRIAAALAGAKAAGDASSQTYNDQISDTAKVAQGQNQAIISNARQNAQQATSVAQSNAGNKLSANSATASNKTANRNQALSGLASLFS